VKLSLVVSLRSRVSAVKIAALFSLALLLTPAFGGVSAGESFKVTTVFLVRHAEKDTAPRENPPLTEQGKRRSEALARALKEANIKAIYTSQFLRTQQTAEPLGRLLGVTPASIELKMDSRNQGQVSEQSLKEIVDKIHARAGESALVVGHSNTIPEVIRMLGANETPAIDEKQFDDLFVVTVYEKGKAKAARLKYGD
jgi:phosphohistidine phosphatase SixA